MPLSVGSRLGHYDVTALIGEGGMGQVYQATDTKLNRQVALKILPEAFASDPDRLVRFQREAQVLASLNHPGIAAIYGLEEADDTRALVLELVEGPNLADRIAQGPIPLNEALPIAKQIAEALEAAHEAGVIHRDLKPANIKVRPDGTVKVLDFGLAKALDTTPEGDPSQSPTLTAAATQMGVIMGTAAYMSPEQAKGRTVDRRGDVWAFGAVLYEMLTGQRAFAGSDVSEVLASVLAREPDWTLLPRDVSPVLGIYFRRCLQKDPKQRIGDVQDIRLALEGAFETTSVSTLETATPQAAGWRHVAPWVAAVVLAGLVTGVGVWNLRPPPPARSPERFVVSAPPSATPSLLAPVTALAISPDGRTIAYRAVVDGEVGLYVRHLDQLEGELLPGTEGAANIFFSPDGTEVGFVSPVDQSLKKIRVAGGPAVTLCPMPGVPRGASWGPNGTIIFAAANAGLFRVSSAGGEPEVLIDAEGREDHDWPDVLPRGHAVLFTTDSEAGPGNSQLAVLDLETGDQRGLPLSGSHPRYLSSGHLVYSSSGNTLWAVRFNPDRLEVVGEPIPVLEGVETGASGGANVAVSRNGTLVHEGGGARRTRTLAWVDRQGNEEAIAAEPRPYTTVSLSPNGRQVMTQVGSIGESVDLVLFDLTRDTATPFTFSPGFDAYPQWTPDGQQVVFYSIRDDANHILMRAADGTGQVETLMTSENLIVPLSFSPDGRTLVFVESRPETGFDIGTLSLDGEGRTEWLLEDTFSEGRAQVSQDGRWMAYLSTEADQFDIFVRPFPNVDDGRFPIARNAGTPVWGPDGRELFYQRLEDGAIMVVPIDTEPTFSAGNPTVLFDGPYARGGALFMFDTTDGQRFLMIKEPSATDITLVQNFDEELRRLFPDQ